MIVVDLAHVVWHLLQLFYHYFDSRMVNYIYCRNLTDLNVYRSATSRSQNKIRVSADIRHWSFCETIALCIIEPWFVLSSYQPSRGNVAFNSDRTFFFLHQRVLSAPHLGHISGTSISTKHVQELPSAYTIEYCIKCFNRSCNLCISCGWIIITAWVPRYRP